MMPSPGPRRPLEVSEALAAVGDARARAALLVEGWSDEQAVMAATQARGISLACERIIVLPIGGVTNLARFAQPLRASFGTLHLAGLYDAGEERVVLRALTRGGLAAAATRADAQAAGFYACDADLEDELIRALGPEAVAGVVRAEGEMASFCRFQAQPAQRGRALAAQLRRFIGTRAGRKIRYGGLLVRALAPGDVPAPLSRLLDRVTG